MKRKNESNHSPTFTGLGTAGQLHPGAKVLSWVVGRADGQAEVMADAAVLLIVLVDAASDVVGVASLKHERKVASAELILIVI